MCYNKLVSTKIKLARRSGNPEGLAIPVSFNDTHLQGQVKESIPLDIDTESSKLFKKIS
jgi:hypothetical protein